VQEENKKYQSVIEQLKVKKGIITDGKLEEEKR